MGSIITRITSRRALVEEHVLINQVSKFQKGHTLDCHRKHSNKYLFKCTVSEPILMGGPSCILPFGIHEYLFDLHVSSGSTWGARPADSTPIGGHPRISLGMIRMLKETFTGNPWFWVSCRSSLSNPFIDPFQLQTYCNLPLRSLPFDPRRSKEICRSMRRRSSAAASAAHGPDRRVTVRLGLLS